jgi:iron-sulfur cluster insertion protein
VTDDGGLQLTDSAISQLNALITSKANPELRFRVYVQGGGCSGFQYGFQFEEEAATDDMEFDRNGVKLVVDPLSLQYLSGAEVDFIDDLMGTRFIVNNPNASTTCGCGASFGI